MGPLKIIWKTTV